MPTINLIPQEERIEQTKTKVVKFSTILAILIFIIVGAIGGYMYYKTTTVKTELAAVETEIESLRGQISSLSKIEVNARNLYRKSSALQTIFETRNYYSIMVDRMEESTPAGITIDSLSLGKDQTIAISGRANAYNDVQDFTNRLLGKELFTEVELKSVGLENRQDKVNFFIVVTYNEALLRG